MQHFVCGLDDAVVPAQGRIGLTFTQVNDPITHTGKDDFYNNDIGAYLEDTWKLRPSITLNIWASVTTCSTFHAAQPNMATPLLTLYTSTLNIDKTISLRGWRRLAIRQESPCFARATHVLRKDLNTRITLCASRTVCSADI